MNILINILLGFIPEILYFWLFIVIVFDIKERRTLLLCFETVIYLLTMIIKPYDIVYYVAFIVLEYLVLHKMYKDKIKIADAFMLVLALIYIAVAYTIAYAFSNGAYSNYFISLVASKILLFIPFIFRKQLRKTYLKFRVLWDKPRTLEEKRRLKSITLRVICLVLSFVFTCCLYVLAINIIKSFS